MERIKREIRAKNIRSKRGKSSGRSIGYDPDEDDDNF
jgi:hypothetical protein